MECERAEEERLEPVKAEVKEEVEEASQAAARGSIKCNLQDSANGPSADGGRDLGRAGRMAREDVGTASPGNEQEARRTIAPPVLITPGTGST